MIVAIGLAVRRVAIVAAATLWLATCVDAGPAPVMQASMQPQPEPPAPDRAAPREIRSPLGSYLAGRLAHHENDTAAAVRYFSRALAEDPENLDLLRQTYLAMHAEGRMLEAVTLARRVVEINPKSPIAALTLAIEAIRTDDFDAAQGYLNALPLDGYNNILVPVLRAWSNVGLERFDAAHEALKVLDERDDLAAFRDFHVALIEDLAGNTTEAEQAYRSTLSAQPGGTYRAVAAFGSFLERNGRGEAALEVYGSFQAKHPDNVWLEPSFARVASGQTPERMVRNGGEGAAELLFGVTSALHQSNAFGPALLYARAALHLRPGFDSAELLLSEILGALKRPAEAISAYQTIPPDSPLHWSMRLRVAANLDELDRNEEAVAELRAMAAERPERTDALMALGSLMRSKERWVEAVAAYDEAIARIAKPEERHWRALYARGIALERSKQWQRGEQDFLKALELRPDQPYVMNYLGYSWVDKGVNLERALKMIERAVELRPNDGYIIDSLGWALYRMGKFEDSAEHLERAVELRPEDPTINDHLGDAYWRVGRRIEARFQWRRALALEPEEEETVATIEAKILKGLSPSAAAAADDGT